MKLTLIVGPMFSGKSTELVKRMRRAHVAGKNPAVIKSEIDNRYDDSKVVTHDGSTVHAVPVKSGMLAKAVETALCQHHRVIGIDEAQFFSWSDMSDLRNVLVEHSDLDVEIVLAGLDRDFLGRFFQFLLFWSETDGLLQPRFVELSAVCTAVSADKKVCGADATYTQRIDEHGPVTQAQSVLSVGGADKYEARCPKCFIQRDDPHVDI